MVPSKYRRSGFLPWSQTLQLTLQRVGVESVRVEDRVRGVFFVHIVNCVTRGASFDLQCSPKVLGHFAYF